MRQVDFMMPLIVLALVVPVVIPVASHPYTWRVPSEHPTICGAVDSASYGDTVLVAPGTYCREKDIDTYYGWVWIRMHDGITLMSEAGRDVTVLLESGEQGKRSVRFHRRHASLNRFS